MKKNPNLERAQSYISLNLTPTSRTRPVASQPRPPFVTLSREAGAGATTLANLLVQSLNRENCRPEEFWRVYDGNLVESMLRHDDLPDHLARFLPEDTLSEIDSSIGEILGRHPNLWEMIQKTNQLIRHLAQQGNCILIGRAANFVTADFPHGLHVRLIGRTEDRENHMAEKLGLSPAEARVRNERRDAARRRFVKSHYSREVEDASNYDLVLNTSRIRPTEAVGMLTAMIRSLTPANKNPSTR